MLLLAVLACASNPCADDEVRRDGVCAPYVAGDPVAADVWRPTTGTTWQWQLTASLDLSRDVEAYDVDLFDVTPAVREALSEQILICYFSAGSLEDWRPDVDAFPSEAVGRRLDGWPDERWLDVTDAGVRDAMAARLDKAVESGCDAVEPDNVTAWSANSGFQVSALEQLDYNRWLADEAHLRDLSIGLKNDTEQIPELIDWFDWALNEECHSYDECDTYAPFVDAEMAVLHTEYVDDLQDAGELADELCGLYPGLSTLVKDWDLGPEFTACWAR